MRIESPKPLIAAPKKRPEEEQTPGCFPRTQWTQILEVIQSGDDKAAFAALEEFCLCYRPAIVSFFRRHGCAEDQAEEYTQEFFAGKILKRWSSREGFLHTAKRGEQRRFRSYLCHVLWWFWGDERKRSETERRGGGVQHVSLEETILMDERCGDEEFQRFGRQLDREIARQIIRRAADRSKHGEYLLAHLAGKMTQHEAAQFAGISDNAFKQAYSNLRKRLDQYLWDEVAKMVGPDEGEVRIEIRYLMSLFGDDQE